MTFVVSRGGIAGGKPATQFADLGLCANGASAPLLFGRVSRFPDIVTTASTFVSNPPQLTTDAETSACRSSAYLLVLLGHDSGSLH